MPDTAALTTPPLRPIWKSAKQEAEKKATELKEAQKFTDTQKKMKGDLGPDLESWPKAYPDFGKLKTGKAKIDVTIKQYADAVTSSSLNDKVKKPMVDALTKIKKAMDERLDKAEELILTDEKLGMKESKKKQIPPLILFNLDVAKQVMEKAGKTKLKATKIQLEVILADDKVIKNVPADLDDNKLAVKIREAADFHTIVDQLAKLLVELDPTVKSDKDLPAAQKKFEDGMDKIIEAALTRAAKPILELVGVRSDYKMYKIKSGVTLGAAIAGLAGGVIALAITPLSFGASTIFGIIGIIQASASVGLQISKLSDSAEELIGHVATDIDTLNKQYQKASANLLGVGELAKTLVNATFVPAMTTIKGCKGDCDQVHDKINGLTVRTHDESQNLGKLLTSQSKLQKELGEFEKLSAKILLPAEIKKYTDLDKALDSSAKVVTQLMSKIETLDARVEKCSTSHKILSGAINQLAAKEPTWAKVGEILITAAAAAGFLIAGNVNVPDPYKCADLVGKINTDLSNVLGSLQGAYAAANDLKDMLEKRSK